MPPARKTCSAPCSKSVSADRFIEEVRGDDPELAANLRIEERELEAGGRN
jgi:hypothetical protein